MRTSLAYALSVLMHAAALGGVAIVGVSTTGPRYREAPGHAFNARFSAGMAGVKYDEPVRFEAALNAASVLNASPLEPDDSLTPSELELPLEAQKTIDVERRQTDREEVRQEPELNIEAPASELVIETPSAVGPRHEARESSPTVSEVPPAVPPLRRSMAVAPPATGTGVDPLPFQLGAQLGSSGAVDGPRGLPVNLPPAYPREAWLARMEGQVTLRIKIAADGTVETARIERSSGWPILDEAALVAIRRWRFEPARRNGVPVTFELLKPFTFRISS